MDPKWYLIALKHTRMDSPRYLNEISKLAKQGHVYSQVELGCTYHDILKNYAEAAKWWHMAAEQGCIDAAYALGLMYEQGNGVTRNYVTAYMWYRLVADVVPAESWALEFTDRPSAKTIPSPGDWRRR